MKRSIELGACFFAKKPLDINTVENLWQHVLNFKKHSKRESVESAGDREFHRTDRATLNEEEENRVDAKEKEGDTPKQEANKGCAECSKDTTEGEEKMESEDDNLSKLRKKPISWCSFLQQKFLDALEILGDENVQLNGYATSNPTQALQQFAMSQPPILVSTIGELSTQSLAYGSTNDTFHYGGQTFQDHAPNYDSVANKGEFGAHESSTCEVEQQYYYDNISNNNNNMVENFQKVVDDDDFGDVEKFAYGDDPWLSILQDVTEGGLDLDISDV
ncbi:two-component response regulator ORR28-like [Ananas comosus]|uniref:Two-component response regulator ORR28-like n=1 Tax=Ananas comosus TaxID=4615 RepID=A0A6P5H233_ANACO|nr:two-component response regulator ORR28-like [Ananas comosus]